MGRICDCSIDRFTIEWVERCGLRVEINHGMHGKHGKRGSGILSASRRTSVFLRWKRLGNRFSFGNLTQRSLRLRRVRKGFGRIFDCRFTIYDCVRSRCGEILSREARCGDGALAVAGGWSRCCTACDAEAADISLLSLRTSQPQRPTHKAERIPLLLCVKTPSDNSPIANRK